MSHAFAVRQRQSDSGEAQYTRPTHDYITDG